MSGFQFLFYNPTPSPPSLSLLFPAVPLTVSQSKRQEFDSFTPATVSTSRTASGIYNRNSSLQREAELAPVLTSHIKPTTPVPDLALCRNQWHFKPSLTRARDTRREGWVGGGGGGELRGSGLFSSGDAADPDESKDLRRPTALEETHTD